MIERKTVLNRLTLRNFRRFEEITLELDEKLTLLVAENGGGKTAMLDGIALALLSFANDLLGAPRTGFWLSDVRLSRSSDGTMEEQFPLAYEAAGFIDGNPERWSRQLVSAKSKTTNAQAVALDVAARRILSQLGEYADRRRDEAPPLPVIAYYGTGRPWSPQRRTEGKKNAAKDLTIRTRAYLNCLSSFSNIMQFEDWFERVALEAANEKNSEVGSPHRPQSMLAAVRRATDCVLQPSGWKTLDWDFLEKKIVATHPEHGKLPISHLSDGIRNLLAMVADIAHRSVRLNPHFREEACVRSPGIVLIDEVDLFLHPSWQQQVVGLLQEAFPQMQFILTSHSPQVISTVPRECVRVLRGNEWRMPSAQTRGVESAELLAEVMGVNPTPDVEEARWVSEYQHMIEINQDGTDEGKALRKKIEAHFGQQHPVVLDCDRLKRWQAFKLRGSSAADG